MNIQNPLQLPTDVVARELLAEIIANRCLWAIEKTKKLYNQDEYSRKAVPIAVVLSFVLVAVIANRLFDSAWNYGWYELIVQVITLIHNWLITLFAAAGVSSIAADVVIALCVFFSTTSLIRNILELINNAIIVTLLVGAKLGDPMWIIKNAPSV